MLASLFSIGLDNKHTSHEKKSLKTKYNEMTFLKNINRYLIFNLNGKKQFLVSISAAARVGLHSPLELSKYAAKLQKKHVTKHMFLHPCQWTD